MDLNYQFLPDINVWRAKPLILIPSLAGNYLLKSARLKLKPSGEIFEIKPDIAYVRFLQDNYFLRLFTI